MNGYFFLITSSCIKSFLLLPYYSNYQSPGLVSLFISALQETLAMCRFTFLHLPSGHPAVW